MHIDLCRDATYIICCKRSNYAENIQTYLGNSKRTNSLRLIMFVGTNFHEFREFM